MVTKNKRYKTRKTLAGSGSSELETQTIVTNKNIRDETVVNIKQENQFIGKRTN